MGWPASCESGRDEPATARRIGVSYIRKAHHQSYASYLPANSQLPMISCPRLCPADSSHSALHPCDLILYNLACIGAKCRLSCKLGARQYRSMSQITLTKTCKHDLSACQEHFSLRATRLQNICARLVPLPKGLGRKVCGREQGARRYR